jgi:hypothetical protein
MPASAANIKTGRLVVETGWKYSFMRTLLGAGRMSPMPSAHRAAYRRTGARASGSGNPRRR